MCKKTNDSKCKKIFDYIAGLTSIIGCIISIYALIKIVPPIVKIVPVITKLQSEEKFHKDTVRIVRRDTVFIKDIPESDTSLSFYEYVNSEKKNLENYVDEQKKEFENYKNQRKLEFENYLKKSNEGYKNVKKQKEKQ